MLERLRERGLISQEEFEQRQAGQRPHRDFDLARRTVRHGLPR